MTPDIDFSPFYLNTRRVNDLVDPDVLAREVRRVPRTYAGTAQETADLAAYKRALRFYLFSRPEPVPSFEKCLLTGKPAVGTLFTTISDFYCKQVWSSPDKIGLMHVLFDAPAGAVQLRLQTHADHIAPGSPGHWLTGHRSDLFVVAMVMGVEATVVTAVPLMIATAFPGPKLFHNVVGPSACVLSLSHVATFSRATDIRRVTPEQHARLKNIPEADIKQALARIIGESYVEKDWGGEQNDLYTSRLVVDGEERTAAFLLKGPAVFREMTLTTGLGKNGDQLVRLCDSNSDVVVVQHCHKISSAVRRVLQALCNEIGSGKRCLFIDGHDTVRILRAYGECGFSRPRRRVREASVTQPGAPA